MYNVGLDYDGVISGNLSFYTQLAYLFLSNGYGVYIITGAKFERAKEIEKTLSIPYTKFVHRPSKFDSTPYNLGMWKKAKLIQYSIDLWFDNEVKSYVKAGVDFSNIKTVIVRV